MVKAKNIPRTKTMKDTIEESKTITGGKSHSRTRSQTGTATKKV